MENLLAPIEQLSLRQLRKFLELSSLCGCFITEVCNTVFAEVPCCTHYLVRDEDQHQKDGEGCGPFGVFAGGRIRRPHLDAPVLEYFPDAPFLQLEHGEFDLSLCTSRSGSFRVFLEELLLDLAEGFFVKGQASFENYGGDMRLDAFAEQLRLNVVSSDALSDGRDTKYLVIIHPCGIIVGADGSQKPAWHIRFLIDVPSWHIFHNVILNNIRNVLGVFILHFFHPGQWNAKRRTVLPE